MKGKIPSDHKEYCRKYYKNHRDYLLEKNKEHFMEYYPEYYKKNKSKILERHKKYYREHSEERKAYAKKHYQSNKEYYKKYNKKYKRKHALGYGHPCKYIMGLNKRDYIGYCELCGKENTRLVYHHWDDNNLSLGIWVCNPCHWVCEIVEKKQLHLIQRYITLKKFLEKEGKRNEVKRKHDFAKCETLSVSEAKGKTYKELARL